MAEKKNNKANLVSVIIPAYRQQKTIVANVREIEKVLKKIKLKYEIIVVVDGMIDKTFQKAKKIATGKIKVVGYENNHGKGYAIRYGMVRSKGNIIGFIDAGMDLNPDGIAILVNKLDKEKMDIV